MIVVLPAALIPTREMQILCRGELLLGEDDGPDTKGSALGGAVLDALPAIETQMQRERDSILDGEGFPDRQLRHRSLIPPAPDRRGAVRVAPCS